MLSLIPDIFLMDSIRRPQESSLWGKGAWQSRDHDGAATAQTLVIPYAQIILVIVLSSASAYHRLR